MADLTPERIESLARAVEDGTASLADLQSAGLFTDYGGSDLLTNTDAARALIPDKVYAGLQVEKHHASCSLDAYDPNDATWGHGGGESLPRTIIAALIRASISS